jgi:ABC-2 type transport system permease protein
MNTITSTMPKTLRFSARACFHSYLQEIRCEFLSLLRTPSFALPTLLFPPMFYLLFAVLMPLGKNGSWQASHYLLATYTVFGVMGPALFGFGVTVAIERQRGWLTLKRVAPMPPGAYMTAKLVMAMIFAAIIFAIMVAIAVFVADVRLPASAWASLFAVAALGVLPFCAIGLFIGTVCSGQAAPAIVNLIYLPMGFLAGLWFPLTILPAFVQQIAPLWPAYHLGQMALAGIGQPIAGDSIMHLIALMVVTILFFALARRRLVRD